MLTTRRQRIFIWIVTPLMGVGSLLAYLAWGGQNFLNAAVLSAIAVLLGVAFTLRGRRRR